MSIERELQKNYQEVFYPPMPEPEVQPAAAEAPMQLAEVGATKMADYGYSGERQATMTDYDPTMREKLSEFLQAGFEKFGMDRYKARQNAQTLLGGASSNLPMQTGIADIVPFLGTALQTQEAARSMGQSVESAKQGNYGTAALEAGLGVVGMIPGAAGTIKAAKALPKNLPVGMSTQAVGGMEGVLQPAAKATAQPSELGFYSAVEQAALNIQRKSGTGQAMLNDISKGENVKADEIKWIGLDDFLSGKKNVTKQEVQEFIVENKVDVKEVQLGGEVPQDYKKQYNEITDLRDRGGQISNDEWRRRITKLNTQYGFTPDAGPSDALRTRYDRFTLPGGENYREILLTMPGGFYRSSHFDQPNILAHIRVNDRVDADGKKMLLIEEVQSDWHQEGRAKGYGNQPQYAAEMEGDPAGFLGMKEGVPQAPFKDTWYQLALKRALKYATDNGYERVGLTTGKQQADRFDLSKQVQSISYEPTEKGFYINIISDEGENVLNGNYSVKELEGTVGKEVTQKIISGEGKNRFDPEVEPDLANIKRLEGVDLKVGGEGMKKYYDEIYPQFLAKYGKKWNATVGETRIKTGRGVPGGEPVRYIDITPSMKESVSKGQPLFSATGLATGAGAGTMATSQQEPK